jgi:hypothetical protein
MSARGEGRVTRRRHAAPDDVDRVRGGPQSTPVTESGILAAWVPPRGLDGAAGQATFKGRST